MYNQFYFTIYTNVQVYVYIEVYLDILLHAVLYSVPLFISMPVDVLHTSMFVLFSSVCDNILINITQNMVTAFLKVYLH